MHDGTMTQGAAAPSSPDSDGRPPLTLPAMQAYFPNGSLGGAIRALPEHNVVYIRNNKAACSTITLWLHRLHTGDHDFSPKNIHAEDGLPRPREITWPKVIEMLSGGAYRFTFVRDPIKRVMSAYTDKLVRQRRWRPQIQKILGLPEDPQSPVTFDQFIDALEAEDDLHLDPHFRPQHFNLMHGLVEYDFIGKLENFDADFAKVRAEANLPDDVPLEVRNVSKAPESSPFDGRPDLLERVKAIYRRDFEIYGY